LIGHLNKVAMFFKECFWDSEAESVGFCMKELSSPNWNYSLMNTIKVPILISFFCTTNAIEIESETDQQILDKIMTQFRKFFKNPNLEYPKDYLITRWSSNPLCYGAYSYNPLGITEDDRAELAKSINGSLFFAGEATNSQHYGTVYGGFLSGLRVSSEISKIHTTSFLSHQLSKL